VDDNIWWDKNHEPKNIYTSGGNILHTGMELWKLRKIHQGLVEMVVVLKETKPYISLSHDRNHYIIHIFDGEESVDIPLSETDPEGILETIAVYVGDYY